MAVSRTAAQFGDRIAIRQREIVEGHTLRVRRATAATLKTAVDETPVLTGKARASWLVTKGRRATRNVEPDVPGSPTAARAQALRAGLPVINSWRAKDRPLVVSNTTDYLALIDQGTATIAPRNITIKAIQAGQAAARSVGRVLKSS